jgi:hypothetical protein
VQWIGIAFAVVGLALLLIGFARNNRYILVVAGISLFLGGSFPDFARGYLDGYNGTRGQSSDSN